MLIRLPCRVVMKKWTVAACVLLVVPLSCLRKPPDWYEHQDLSVEMPRYGKPEVDMIVDGPTLRAIRLAADDWLPPSSGPEDCSSTQAAHVFRVSHRDDIIFVEVLRDPTACGGQGYALDGNATYAISRSGRILRRAVDGDGTYSWPLDAGTWEILPTTDAGVPIDEIAIVDFRTLPPEILDAGLPADFLAGIIAIWPDGGVTKPEHARLPSDWDGGLIESRWLLWDLERLKARQAKANPPDAGTPGPEEDAGSP